MKPRRPASERWAELPEWLRAGVIEHLAYTRDKHRRDGEIPVDSGDAKCAKALSLAMRVLREAALGRR